MEINFGETLHRFIISEEIAKELTSNDCIVLTVTGIPSKILSNNFVYSNEIVKDENGNLVLGYNTHVPEWKLRIDPSDSSVFYSGKGKHSKEVYGFYNSSLSQLMLSLFSYIFFH